MRRPHRPRRLQRRVSFGRGRRSVLLGVFATLLVLVLASRAVARFATDVWWFRSLGQGQVFGRIVTVQIMLAVVFSFLAGVALLGTSLMAERMAPFEFRIGTAEQLGDRYRLLMARSGRTVRAVSAALFGLLAGVPVAGMWKEWLLFGNPVSFGQADPQFHRDASFYVFRLPWITFMLDWMFTVAVVCSVVAVAIHYVHGGIRLSPAAPGGPSMAASTRLHLAIVLAGLAFLKAVGYYFDRYRLVTSRRGVVDGALYTDVHAKLPALVLLLLISLLACTLLLATVRRHDWHLPLLVVGAWLVVSLVAGVVFPAAVQRLQVKSDEPNKERTYLQRNVTATRTALGLDKVETTSIEVGAVDAGQVADAADQLANARLLDPQISTASFVRLAGQSGDYTFSDLDVDRYVVGGRLQQVVIGARELSPDGPRNDSWVTRHLGYTHGLGVVAAPASKMTESGRPAFIDPAGQGATASPALAVVRNGIYVGPDMGSYSVVNTKVDEQDGNGVVAPRYDAANGGVRLSSTLRRAAFALRFGEWNLFARGPITPQSRILFVRDVRARLAKLAPFLATDADPYPVVLDGQILWVVDGYTTTDQYPYAQHADTSGLRAGSGLLRSFNYVRNSVKAVVNAYDGSVRLYVIDDTDRIVAAWRDLFPSLFSPLAALPAGLAEHFRYPEDLFRVQSKMWGTYRLSDPQAFYYRNGSWDVVRRPPREQDRQATPSGTTAPPSPFVPFEDPNRAKDDQRIDPYYALLTPPGGTAPEFVLLRSFGPYSKTGDRPELAAYMTASSEPGSYGKLRVYEVAGARPNGPFDVAATVSKRFAAELTLKDSAGSKVVFGDLQLVPVGSGIVWVRPWYLQETSEKPIPELKTVTVASGNDAAVGPTLEAALRTLFGGDPGFSTVIGGNGPPAEAITDPSTGGQGAANGGGGGGSGGTATTPTTVTGAGATSSNALLAQAAKARGEAQAALKAGDLGTYQLKMEEAYRLAAQAASIALGTTVTAGPVPAPGTGSSAPSTTVATSSTSRAGVQGPTTSVTTPASSTSPTSAVNA